MTQTAWGHQRGGNFSNCTKRHRVRPSGEHSFCAENVLTCLSALTSNGWARRGKVFFGRCPVRTDTLTRLKSEVDILRTDTTTQWAAKQVRSETARTPETLGNPISMVDIGGYATGWPAIAGTIVGIGVTFATNGCVPCGAAAGGAVSGAMGARENGTNEFQGAFVGAFIASVSAKIGYEVFEGKLFGPDGVLHTAVAGAISGAVAGGMSAVIYGGDARAVLTGAAVGAGVSAAMYGARGYVQKIYGFRANVVGPPAARSGWEKFWTAVTSHEATEVVAAVAAVAIVATILAPPIGVLIAEGTLTEAFLALTTGATLGGAEAAGVYENDVGFVEEQAAFEGAEFESTGSMGMFRYVGPGEAAEIQETGMIPNVDETGRLKNVFFTDAEFTSGQGAKDMLGLRAVPTHRVTFNILQARPTWGTVNSLGATEFVTPNPIFVHPGAVSALENP